MSKRIRSTRGITLMELMSTVVIIGIVAAMAVPRFTKAFERIHFRSANRELVTSVRLARSNAITEKAPYGVYFDVNRQMVVLFKDTYSPSTFSFESSSDSILRVDTLPAEVNYLGTDMTGDVLVFQPNGSAQFVGGGNIVMLATTEATVAIATHNVLASTGRIESHASYY